ncbi:MAG TPA: protein kinase, partial [Polyangiales bacterium]|nr:protein kinase [Polyangiales bacterium]
MLLPAMRGVAAAHRQGVVHRDLKPDNIFLAYEEDGVRREAKVLDFGISKLASDDQSTMHLTRTGAVIGTPYYMSPEQIRGKAEVDRRSDVYAFGVILYESLGGQVPFMAETYGALVLEIATGTPKPLTELVPNIPLELSRIVMCAMARDVNARYPTMEDLIAALETFTRPATSGAWRASQRMQAGSGERPMFDATRAAPTPVPPRISLPLDSPSYSGPLPPAVDTRPSRATTPFAAEALRPRSPGTRQIYGVAGLIAVAAAIVAAALYLTRDPAPDPVVVAPIAPLPTETKSAASTELQLEEIPRGVSAGAVPPADIKPSNTADAKPIGSETTPSSDVAPITPQRSSKESRRDAHRSSSKEARKSADRDQERDK